MSWFENLIPSRIRTDSNTAKKKNIPEGLWTQCKNCHSALYRAEVERNLEVCPKCQHHMRISARKRIEKLLDKGSMVELDANLKPVDILKFKDLKRYKDRFTAAQNSTKEHDALITAQGTIHGLPIVAGAFEFNFMGGSMGSVVGEKFVRAVNVAIEQQSALVIYSASGGARMQEALFSLMQMAKTSAALTRLADQNLPFISVLTDPTMGGVSASFATLGDIIIAEPNALIGFAGPRVIEQTVRETLPEGFQRSEFLLEKGSVDKIINRLNMRSELADLLCIMLNKPRPETIHEEAMRQQELQNRDLTSDANKPE